MNRRFVPLLFALALPLLAVGVDAATISGRVTRAADGSGVTGAFVDFDGPGEWWERAVTDAEGRYTLTAPDGEYQVQAFANDENMTPEHWPGVWYWNQREALVVAGSDRTAIDFQLEKGGRISGTIRGIQPGEGGTVAAANRDWSFAGYGYPDENGAYEILGFPPGEYLPRIVVDGYVIQYWDHAIGEGTATYIPLAAGEDRAGVDFDLVREAVITGRLVDSESGAPLAGAGVELGGIDVEYYASANTGDDGVFRAAGLPAGSYRLSLHAPDHVSRDLRDGNGDWIPFVVATGETLSGLEFGLDPSGAIAGTIRNSAGEPLSGAYVEAIVADGWETHAFTTGADGAYRIDGLTSGDWLVYATHPSVVALFYGGAGEREGATPIPVSVPETVSGIDLVLPPAGAIAGRVSRTSDGAPLEGVAIEAFYGDDRFVLGAWTLSGPDGTFEVGGVPPNQPVLLRANDWQSRYGTTWWPGVAISIDATPLIVRADEPLRNVDFTLGEPGVLELSAESFSFTGTTFGGELPAQTLVIRNLGPGDVVLGAWGDSDWMSVGCDLGSPLLAAGATVDVDVAAYAFGMAPGAHTGQIHIWDAVSNRERLIPVTLTLVESPAQLEISRTELAVTMEEGLGEGLADLSLSNVGGGVVDWVAIPDDPRVVVVPASGTLARGSSAAVLSVRVAAGLPAGDYLSSLRIEATTRGVRTTSTAQVPIGVSVTPPAGGNPLVGVPSIVHVFIPSGRNGRPELPQATTSFEVTNGGTGTLHWRSNSATDWLRLSPEEGSVPAGGSMTVGVTIETVALATGGNSAVLEVASGRESRAVSIEADLGSTVETGPVEPAPNGELVIPVLVHAPGNAGAQFVSDLWISYLPTGRSVDALLSFVPRGGDGSVAAITTPVRFESGQTISLLDVVGSWLQGAIPAGSLVLRSTDIGAFEMASRTYNVSDEGTFGQEIPAIPSSGGVGALGGSLFAPGLRKSAAFRTNLLLTEVTGSPATARIRLFGPGGAAIGVRDVDVAPFATVQVNDVVGAVGGVPADGVLADVSVVSGGGKVAALASVVDNRTNDPTTLLAQPRRPGESTLVVPVVAHAPGLAGTQWVTDVAVANADRTPRAVTLSYFDRTGAAAGTLDRTIAPGETLALDDVVRESFGVESGRGHLRITAAPAGGLVATSRIYNDAANGTFGQGVPALPRGSAIGTDGGFHHLIGLSNGEAFRTNVGITEVAGAEARVALALVDQSSDRIVGYREIGLAANAQFQENVFALFGYADVEVRNASVFVRVVGGTGRVLSYASMVDNRTGDGTTLLPPARMTQER